MSFNEKYEVKDVNAVKLVLIRKQLKELTCRIVNTRAFTVRAEPIVNQLDAILDLIDRDFDTLPRS